MSVGGKITFVGADNKVYSVGRDGFGMTPDNIVEHFGAQEAKIYDSTRLKIELALKDHTRTGDVDVETYFAECAKYPRTNSHAEAKRLQLLEEDNRAEHERRKSRSQRYANESASTKSCVGCVRVDEDTTTRDPDCPVHGWAALAENRRMNAPPATRPKDADIKKAVSSIRKPIIDDKALFGTLDRALYEMKYILDHPGEFDTVTFQTMKGHLVGMGQLQAYAAKMLVALGIKKSLANSKVPDDSTI